MKWIFSRCRNECLFHWAATRLRDILVSEHVFFAKSVQLKSAFQMIKFLVIGKVCFTAEVEQRIQKNPEDSLLANS